MDDFLFAGTDNFNIDPIVKKYEVVNFCSVGLNVSQDKSNAIHVNQNEYAAEMQEIPVSAKSDWSSTLNKNEIQKLKATAGQLNWLATQIQPDLSYDALELNISRQHPTVEQLLRANKLVHQVKQAQINTCFPNLGSFKEYGIDVYCDASWGNLVDGQPSRLGL